VTPVARKRKLVNPSPRSPERGDRNIIARTASLPVCRYPDPAASTRDGLPCTFRCGVEAGGHWADCAGRQAVIDEDRCAWMRAFRPRARATTFPPAPPAAGRCADRHAHHQAQGEAAVPSRGGSAHRASACTSERPLFAAASQTKVANEKLVFGAVTTDHMLEVRACARGASGGEGAGSVMGPPCAWRLSHDSTRRPRPPLALPGPRHDAACAPPPPPPLPIS
jgi:hypothetical protein